MKNDTAIPKPSSEPSRLNFLRWGTAAASVGFVAASIQPAAAADPIEAFVCATRDAGDTFQNVGRRLNFNDNQSAKGSILNIDHRGDGTGNQVSPGQTYGLDIHNYPGAKSALVIHQYSSVERAVIIDNTGAKPAIEINNTRNDVLNPGSDGIGDYLLLRDHNNAIFRLDKDLVVRLAGPKTLTVIHTAAKAFSVQTAGTYNGDTMDIVKSGSGLGAALKIVNFGTGPCLQIRQDGLGNALEIRNTINPIFTVSAAGAITSIQGKTVSILAGTGNPEGTVAAPQGSLFLRTDSGQGPSLFVKESGNITPTGWKPK
ncbi:hypothetical protein J2X01_002459 [Arthrobacter ginsengisoli]|uniref:Uncharacterized protein n=1 Tax=Arthrobacter ginsengisoli TaxID=1356565 RepID=A0ABU1UDA3_9MICC|nr:hypothetical protein [Arthrobacter ginsengisoli]MDR7083166.1 hypothetical protein [Arthrobacter ginsengisoli]